MFEQLAQGQLYVIGGSNGHSDELSCGERYDPQADEWIQVPELRTNRCNAGKWNRVTRSGTSWFSLQLAQRVDSSCRRLLLEQQAVRCGRIRPLRSEGPEEL